MIASIVIITAALIAALLLIVPLHALAASENDMKPMTEQQKAITTVRQEPIQTVNTVTPNAGHPMVLTAATSKSQVRPGNSVALVITAHTPNGTAIDNATMKAWITNYINNTNKMNMSAKTDKTGDATIKFKIAKDAKTSQWLIQVQGDKPGFRQADISTGFAVTEFSGHDFSGKTKTKCSGSSCK